MKKLEIDILYKDIKIGAADYINVVDNLVTFSNFRVENELDLSSNSKIEIVVSYKTDRIYTLNVIIQDSLVLQSVYDLQLYVLVNDTEDFYNQNVINILNKWDKENDIDWRRLSETEKSHWLTACVIFNGVTHEFTSKEKYIFDCSSINSEIDFFCLLGEVMIGERGYLGKGIDSFEDSMLDIKSKEEYGNSTLIFLESNSLKKIFSDYEDFNLIKKNFLGKKLKVDLL